MKDELDVYHFVVAVVRQKDVFDEMVVPYRMVVLIVYGYHQRTNFMQKYKISSKTTKLYIL